MMEESVVTWTWIYGWKGGFVLREGRFLPRDKDWRMGERVRGYCSEGHSSLKPKPKGGGDTRDLLRPRPESFESFSAVGENVV